MKQNKWLLSHWNHSPDLLSQLNFISSPKIHDQTLRDGTQFSGIEFSDDEKVQIAARLDSIGVHRIEAGRISMDPAYIKVLKQIASIKRKASIFGFVEMSTDLIKVAADGGVDGVILCFPSNADVITEKMGSTVDEVLKLAIDMVKTAENLGLRIILFPTDASRAEADHYKKMISEVITAGKIEAVTFVDTIGGCCTQAIPHIINFLKSFTSLPLEVHFHNDFGLATANTIAALTCGVSTAHTTVLGIGERSGNAAFEQVVMILKTMFDKDLSIKYEQISDLCRYVSKAANFPIPTNRPFVGEKIFEIECLENLMGYLNSPQEIAIKYTFPYHWDVVGHRAADFSAGAETSEELFEIILKALNLDISSERKQHILKTIQQRAISEKHSFVSNEIINLVKKS